MLKAEEQMELDVLKKHGASIRGLVRGRRDGRAIRCGAICAMARRRRRASRGRSGQRSSTRSRITSSGG